jgi:hypothetical protein
LSKLEGQLTNIKLSGEDAVPAMAGAKLPLVEFIHTDERDQEALTPH